LYSEIKKAEVRWSDGTRTRPANTASNLAANKMIIRKRKSEIGFSSLKYSYV